MSDPAIPGAGLEPATLVLILVRPHAEEARPAMMSSSQPLESDASRADTLRHQLRTQGRGLASGLEFFCLYAALIALMAATGRVAMAWYRRPLSPSLPRWYLAAIWRDLVAGVPYLALLVAPLMVLILAASAISSRGRSALWLKYGLQTLLALTALIMWISAVSFCESLIQRGTLPVWHDFMGGMDAAFLSSAVANVWYARYVVPAAVAWPLALALMFVYGRRRNLAGTTPSRWGFLIGFGGACLLFAVATHPVHAPRLALPRVLVETPGVTDPFGRFFRSVAVALSGAPTHPRRILEGASLPMERAREGAGLLGLHFNPADRGCTPHPWAGPLAEEGDGGLDGSSTEAGLRSISRALWDKPDGPLNDILVFQVSLESFRGDDLAALNPQAPRNLAPFINGLYESARTGTRAVIAARQFWQGGVRTSQGMSAFTCGLGALPHGISLVRDLETVPLRCLSDVLVDAGFKATFAYGSHADFDNMQSFLTYHGFDVWLTQDTLPKNLPQGEWDAISDRALMQQTLAHFVKVPPQPSFTLLMTLSNHSPFRPPQDYDAAVKKRVAQALATHPNVTRKEDEPRLLTYSYTDSALEEFFRILNSSGLAARSIVIVHADHATGERYVWPRQDGGDPITDEAKGRIPFLIVFPEALVARVADGEALRRMVKSTQAAMDAAPVSLNDVPLWLLNLLSFHPGVKNLPANWRWHSLGGMTASPAFHPPGDPPPRLWGVNGMNQLFFLNKAGQVTGELEDLLTLTHPDELFTATRPLFGAAALWSNFLRGYAKRCASPSHTRMRAGVSSPRP